MGYFDEHILPMLCAMHKKHSIKITSEFCDDEFEEIGEYSNINMEDDLAKIDISREQELIDYLCKED